MGGSIMASPDTRNSRAELRVLAGNTDPTTEYMLDVCLDTKKYALEFSRDHSNFLNALTGNTHDIYMIDLSMSQAENKLEAVQQIAELNLRHKVRILALLDVAPPPEMNRMQSFGPFCALEVFFTRERLNKTLQELMDIKDTGSRVKADEKFFDVSIFKK